MFNYSKNIYQIHTLIIITEDGSHSLFVPQLNEHHYSTHGATQESRHVYIESGFCASASKQINVLEVGFGTGLNTFLTLLESEKTETQVHYTTLALYPLDCDKANQLNYPKHISETNKVSLFLNLHTAEWN